MEKHTSSKHVAENMGAEKYDHGIRHLQNVRRGEFEGFLPIFRKRAGRLLRFAETLNDKQKKRIYRKLGWNEHRTTEDALIRLKKRKGRE